MAMLLMDQNELSFFYPVLVTVISFFLWYFLFNLTRKIKDETVRFFISKLAGLIFLGILPFVIVRLFFSGISSAIRIFPAVWPETIYDLGILFGLCALIFAFIAFAASKDNSAVVSEFPEMRLKQWKLRHIFISVAGWIIYLSGYEYLFRGILLKGILINKGVAIAVIINVILYFAAHFYKDRREMFASIPFGIVLCIAAIISDSVLVPFILHLTVALSSEFWGLYKKSCRKGIIIKGL